MKIFTNDEYSQPSSRRRGECSKGIILFTFFWNLMDIVQLMFTWAPFAEAHFGSINPLPSTVTNLYKTNPIGWALSTCQTLTFFPSSFYKQTIDTVILTNTSNDGKSSSSLSTMSQSSRPSFVLLDGHKAFIFTTFSVANGAAVRKDERQNEEKKIIPHLDLTRF